jgi:hypothetical protein
MMFFNGFRWVMDVESTHAIASRATIFAARIRGERPEQIPVPSMRTNEILADVESRVEYVHSSADLVHQFLTL